MRILIDCRCLQSSPPRGGVGVFAEDLIRSILARDHENEYTLFANGVANPRQYLPTFDTPNVQWRIGRWPNRVVNLCWSLVIGRWSFFREADIVFLPNLNFLPPLPRQTKLIVTVHDLSFEHFPDTFTWKQQLWHWMVRPRQLLQRADAIIAVSETTKRDLVETYGIRAEKIHVVYPGIRPPTPSSSPSQGEGEKKIVSPPPVPRPLGISPRSRRGGEGGWSFGAPYILSLAAFEPRKNLDGLIRAFEDPIIHNSYPIIHLVIAGAHGSAERMIRRQVARSLVRDRIHLIGSVSEDEKHALLARAQCFVYPSIWEGFGFPPLEAMAAGVPVVATTGGSLPEVLGDAALLVDPLDSTAIARALARVCTDDMLRGDLIARGRARAAQFQWEDAAVKLFDILQNI